ncbi:uncharacterized protein FA14DRAFT_132103 [Meira miltonrushii]|uniref:Deoxyribonuclease NucA/NucB domain-containing protein n=1 Tax=Meira miltonrushii TaxID=1280837 RepID=A0A316VA86_9BASI|nr:uncharacterized protein FA14DRAFT_132103 [Meira miltonrushii]PWN34487.1 hypothetical protein FA14DRAFT_132103 [Meira miltonrushii]
MVTIRSFTLLALAFASSSLAATVTFDCTKVPNICANDFYAINCVGKPTQLNRDSDDATAHRAANACRSPNRCSGNDDSSNSCDEYPYASSQQGGKGAVTRCVPAHENSVQGGVISSFYSRNSVENGDAYNVAFSNTNGIQYTNSCSNTGNEVIRRSGSAPFYTPRRFITSEGHELLMFESREEPGSLDGVIGQDTYLAHEDRFVKIVRAL